MSIHLVRDLPRGLLQHATAVLNLSKAWVGCSSERWMAKRMRWIAMRREAAGWRESTHSSQEVMVPTDDFLLVWGRQGSVLI